MTNKNDIKMYNKSKLYRKKNNNDINLRNE